MKSNYHNGRKREQCYFCHCGPPLREHHIIPQRFDGPDTTQNVVGVCDLCHKRLERLYDKSFYEWFGINDEKGMRKFHRPCQHDGCEQRPDVLLNMNKSPRLVTHKRGKFVYCIDHAHERSKREYEFTQRERHNSDVDSVNAMFRRLLVEYADKEEKSVRGDGNG